MANVNTGCPDFIFFGDDSTVDAIQKGITTSETNVGTSLESLTKYVDKLTKIIDGIADIAQIDVQMLPVSSSVSAFVVPTAPLRPAIDTTYPAPVTLMSWTDTFPTGVTLETIVVEPVVPPTRPAMDANFGTMKALGTYTPNIPSSVTRPTFSTDYPSDISFSPSSPVFANPPDRPNTEIVMPVLRELQTFTPTPLSPPTRPNIAYQAPTMGTLKTVDVTLDAAPATPNITVPSVAKPTFVSTTVTMPPVPAEESFDVVLPTEPTLVPYVPSFSTAPADPAFGSVGTMTVDPPPDLTIQVDPIASVALPTPFIFRAPNYTTVPDRTGEYPTKPSDTLPPLPTLRTLTLPEIPDVVAFDFDGVLPNTLEDAPTTSFSYVGQEYGSDLLTTLKSQLAGLVLNYAQTSLSDAVLTQMESKAHEKANAEARRIIREATQLASRNGWEVPPEELMGQIMQAHEAAAKINVGENRNIYLTNAQLEQNNIQFAFKTSLELESKLMDLHNSTQQRALEAAKAVVEYAIKLFEVKVLRHNASVELYKTQASVYRDRLQAELYKLEAVKVRLDAQRLIGEMNKDDVALYSELVKGVLGMHQLYGLELQAVKTKLEGDALVLQQNDTAIKQLAEEIKAKSLEYEGYKAAMSGEEIKVNMANALANTLSARASAYKSNIDAKVAVRESDIKIAYDVPLSILTQKTEAFKAVISAEANQAQAFNQINESTARVYSEKVKSAEIVANTRAKLIELKLNRFTSLTTALAKQADVNVATNQNLVEIFKAEQAAAYDGAKVESEIYGNTVQAFSATQQAKKIFIDAANGYNTVLAQVFTAESQAESDRVKGEVGVYDVDSRVFAAVAQADNVKASAIADLNKVFGQIFDSEVNAAISRAKTSAEVYNIDGIVFQAMITAAVEKAKAENVIIQSLVSVYEAKMKGVSDQNKNLVDIYAADIQAYVGLANVEIERLKGQIAENENTIREFEALGKNEAVRLQALGDQYKVDAQVLEAVATIQNLNVQAKISQNKNILDKYVADTTVAAERIKAVTATNENITQMRKIDVDAKTAEIAGLTDVYKTDASVYEAKGRVETARVNADVAVRDQDVRYATAEGQIRIQAAQANVSALLAKIDLLSQAARTMAQVWAQAVAGFASNVHYGAQMGFQKGFSYNTGWQQSEAVQESWSHSD